jgi:hypothetical protein
MVTRESSESQGKGVYLAARIPPVERSWAGDLKNAQTSGDIGARAV